MILALSPGLPTGTDTDTVALMNCLPVLFARASLKLNSESTKKELEKELDVVNQIQGKLGGLKVTDTAATGLKAEQNDTQAAPAAKPAAAAAAADGAQMAEKEAEGARFLAKELEEKRIADEQAAAEVAAEVAAAAAKPKANQNKPVPNADGTCLGNVEKTYVNGDGGHQYSIYSNALNQMGWKLTKSQLPQMLPVLKLFKCETLAQFKALGVPQPRTGLASLIDDWIAGGQSMVVSKIGQGQAYSTYSKIFQHHDWNIHNITRSLHKTIDKGALARVFKHFKCETLAQFKALGVTQIQPTALASQRKKDIVAKYGTIENWNTKFVTNLNCVFSGSKNFNANLSQWDVSNITTLEKGKFFIANFHCQLLI